MSNVGERAQVLTSNVDRDRSLAGALRQELATLRGRRLGECAKCGRAVFSEQNFSRFRGHAVHVRCPI